MNLMFNGQLTNRLTAFKRLQRHPELVGRCVLPSFLNLVTVPPRAV